MGPIDGAFKQPLMVAQLPILAISGRPAFQGGAGEFVGSLKREIERDNLPMKLVSPQRAYPIMESIRRGHFIRGLTEPVRRWISSFLLRRKVSQFARSSSPLIIIHPQSLGLDYVMRVLARRHAPTWFFVLDNWIFCRKAYNSIAGEFRPCFRCLGNEAEGAALMGCQPPESFRRGYTIAAEQGFRRLARGGNLRFMVQTRSQAQLLRKHLGENQKICQIGLEVPDIDSTDGHASESGYDVVYHAAPTWEKGVGVLFALARLLPEFTFLGPFEKAAVEQDIASSSLPRAPNNLHFRGMSWQGELRDAVRTAKMVLCPSIWAAPVEGAVLKSLAHNGVVALFRGPGQFGEDIPRDAVVELNAGDFESSAACVRAVLLDQGVREKLRACAREYIREFKRQNARIGHRMCEAIQYDANGALPARG